MIVDCRLPIAEWLVITLVACGIVGCDRGSEAKTAAAPVKKIEEVRGSGVIRGRVTLDGTPPVMATIANQPCHDGAEPLREETVMVGGGGGLANVFVYVEGLPRVDGSPLPAAMLDQVNCRYVPHALGVTAGQPLRIRSSDPTIHNVHYAPARNQARNFGMTRAGDERTVTLTEPGEFIRVKCDVHPWMSATIGVFDNPFFAVTDENGKFEIRDLPPGDYKLIAWHERYGALEQNVNVSAVQQTIDLKYRQPN
jgi:hypothetical protein